MSQDRVKAEVHRKGSDYFVVGPNGEEIPFGSEHDAWEYLADHHPHVFTVRVDMTTASILCQSSAMARVMMRTLGVFGFHPEHRQASREVVVEFGYPGGVEEAMEALGLDENQADQAMHKMREDAVHELIYTGFSVQVD